MASRQGTSNPPGRGFGLFCNAYKTSNLLSGFSIINNNTVSHYKNYKNLLKIFLFYVKYTMTE